MQNKKLAFSILAVVVLVGAYFMLSKPKETIAPPITENVIPQNVAPVVVEKEASTTLDVQKQKHKVVYSASGFSPAVTSIAIGEAVTFINKSGNDFRPASNPHPTHTDYGSFDSNIGLPNGISYELTFTKAGEWGYHDHLNPKMIGVVVVK